MTSDGLKIARLNAKRDRDVAAMNLVRDLAKNPVLELVGAFVLVEALQRFPADRPIIGNLQGNMLETAIGGIITVQQLAPSLPYLVQGATDAAKLIGPAAMALGAV